MIRIHSTITHLILIIETESNGQALRPWARSVWPLQPPCMCSLIDNPLLRCCGSEGFSTLPFHFFLGPAYYINPHVINYNIIIYTMLIDIVICLRFNIKHVATSAPFLVPAEWSDLSNRSASDYQHLPSMTRPLQRNSGAGSTRLQPTGFATWRKPAFRTLHNTPDISLSTGLDHQSPHNN